MKQVIYQNCHRMDVAIDAIHVDVRDPTPQKKKTVEKEPKKLCCKKKATRE